MTAEPGPRRHAVVVSIVHTPLDARIHYRQIGALLHRGWRVTQAAPWGGYGIDPVSVQEEVSARLQGDGGGRYTTVDLPRASGRQRVGAVRAARRTVQRLAPDAAVVLLHDPELLAAVAGTPLADGRSPVVVWDVHEDTAGALVDKPWLPAAGRRLVAVGVRGAERWAERHLHLLLAEYAYRDRFRRPHPVIPNHPFVPEHVDPPGAGRVVYLGRISRGRGLDTILAAARLLRGEVTIELIGQADPGVRPDLQAAVSAGDVVWYGFVPNDQALRRIEGAAAGLALLRDEPNYRASLPTKVLEYLARGVVPITTPLPDAVEVVRGHECGLVVPFDDPAAVAAAVGRLLGDGDLRASLARRGHDVARRHFDWGRDADRFVATLEAWVEGRQPPPTPDRGIGPGSGAGRPPGAAGD